MDPSDPSSFHHRKEHLSTGRTYHFVDQKPAGYNASTLTILCVHGFPDIWYGWRYQIGPWVRKGYRVLAPDMLGYGGTDKPAAPEEYSTKRLSDDLAALLDVAGVRQVILIGHDWGSYTVGRFALWHPDRLLALVTLSVPYVPPAKQYIPLVDLVRQFPNFGYQLYLSDDTHTREIEENLVLFLRLMYGLTKPSKPMVLPGNLREIITKRESGKPANQPILTEEELGYIHSQMMSIKGPLSYYRTLQFRYEEEKAANLPDSLRADLPVLLIWGLKDATASPAALKRAKQCVPRLTTVPLERVGHWVMLEAKEKVTDTVLLWLEELALAPRAGTKL
ncbi:alpha/beta-hydrolase [Artomyces pyxidatus]|uniref:Alpha/beta-hydrolase n=1 Tax=Artomyces pyxidatus TaxID=48021 RepID=A0ACB8SLZ8_9AGAM|nr:alpha/beta-hydrolase [Artomyces pyxidatus]